MLMYIRLDAPNDINGNPRRIYCIFRNEDMIATVDEGYSGDGKVRKKWKEAKDGGSFKTTIKQYKELLKFHNKE